MGLLLKVMVFGHAGHGCAMVPSGIALTLQVRAAVSVNREIREMSSANPPWSAVRSVPSAGSGICRAGRGVLANESGASRYSTAAIGANDIGQRREKEGTFLKCN